MRESCANCVAHRQRGRSVDRTRQHARARIHFARHRLAVDIAQIQRGDARQQFAVDRHRFARQHEDHVAKLDLVDRNGFRNARRPRRKAWFGWWTYSFPQR